MQIQNFRLRTCVPSRPLTVLLFATAIFLTNCKKDTSTLISTTPDVPTKVIAWLDKSKTGLDDLGKANIDALKQNLDLSAATTGSKSNLYDFLIVPIKPGLNERMKFDKAATLSLMLMTDKTGKIISGNIAGFLPADKVKRSTLPVRLFQGIFGGKPMTEDGAFKFLNVSGKLAYQLEYKNKKLFSTGVVQSKKPGNVIAADVCIDWYLVTTIYYADGTTSSDSEYLYTDCPADHDPNAGQGGPGPVNTTTTVTEDVTYEEEEGSNLTTDDLSDAATYIPIIYRYHADVVRIESTGEITSVEIDPMTLQPTYSYYIDQYGRSVTRYLQLMTPFSSYLILTPTTVMLEWSGIVAGRYTFTDGTPAWTRTWDKSRLEVR